MRTLYIINLFFILFIFTACATPQPKLGELLQTDNATHIQRDYEQIISLLGEYKTKLDLRNSSSFNRENDYHIRKEFKNTSNTFFIKQDDRYIENYNDYLKIALSDGIVKNRNDFLILGIYKNIWMAYKLKDKHQITTLTYDGELLKSLYYSLSVLKWQIKTKKDINNRYLFLTWQNNWQIELEKRIQNGEKPSWELLENLEYIKNGKETLYAPSNFNFETLLSQMLSHVENSLRIIGKAPLDLGIETMKTLVFFL